MKKKITFTKSLIASALALSASYVNASAFQLAEVSSSGLGRAYAGEAAIADNAAVVATNPALMSLFKAKQFSWGGVYVDSNINVNGKIDVSTSPIPSSPDILNVKANQKNIVPNTLIPNLYFVTPINDKFAIGAGMNMNFSLRSKYKDDYVGGVLGGTSEMDSINLNLSGSYRVSKGLSVGAGLNAIYAKAKFERRAGILKKTIDSLRSDDNDLLILLSPSIVSSASSLTFHENSTVARLQDNNAWGLGWNIGAVYEFNQDNRIGIAYHSKVDIDFKDNDTLGYILGKEEIKLHRAKGKLTLHLPSYFEISGFHQLTAKFAMHYSYKYTQWSRLQSLHAAYSNGEVAFHKDENFHDSSRVALGATYDVNDKLTLRAGIAYDESADHPTASIPDTDRTWYSLGATYHFTPNLSVDMGFAHLRGKKQKFKENHSFTSKDNYEVGRIDADYQSTARANLYGLNLNYRF
ncbi:porin [Histophilus somni]|uniref:porin n=1 Tax=Histophilus somni TaxID=731 RepID=UPI00109CF8C6|nr:porin [Histophilus somni]QEH18635.1 porin [Histophilus somni]THA20738.1 porin [Histophilus somni]